MATNEVFNPANRLSVVCSHPTTPASGDPVLVGQKGGVALTDERTDGTTTVQFDGVWDLLVTAVNGSGNSAVAAGDIIYYVTGDAPDVLSKKATGVRFGYALEAVDSGEQAMIRVWVGY